MPADTIARARATDSLLSATAPDTPAISIFTASQPASFRYRIADCTACSLEPWYEPNGRSPITSGVCAPRRTALASITISSIETGTVES